MALFASEDARAVEREVLATEMRLAVGGAHGGRGRIVPGARRRRLVGRQRTKTSRWRVVGDGVARVVVEDRVAVRQSVARDPGHHVGLVQHGVDRWLPIQTVSLPALVRQRGGLGRLQRKEAAEGGGGERLGVEGDALEQRKARAAHAPCCAVDLAGGREGDWSAVVGQDDRDEVVACEDGVGGDRKVALSHSLLIVCLGVRFIDERDSGLVFGGQLVVVLGAG